MKILILDDMSVRHERFAKILKGHKVFHAYNFFDAQKIIEDNDIEMACLDHDLGDEDPEIASFYYNSQGSKVFYNGAHFAYWLSQQDNKCPKRILIHSWNDTGATKMYFYLSTVKHIEMLKVMEFQAEPK